MTTVSPTPAPDPGSTAPAQTPQPQKAPEVPEAKPEFIDIYSGKEFNEAAAVKFATSKPARLIVSAGPVECGKTTLITTLYELFQKDSVSGHIFKGSQTLQSFELKCHLGRPDSGNDESDSERTLYKGPNPFYLHLCVSSEKDAARPIDFLFTDVSGEMFEHATNSTTECKEFLFLKRATHFLLMLDSEKAFFADKWSMVISAKTLLQSCLDSNMLSDFCTVNVVWTKYDYFEAAPPADKKENQEFINVVENIFRHEFGPRLKRLIFSTVAARPKRAKHLGLGKGVPELFQDWIENFPQSRKMDLVQETPVGTRESELFALRYARSD